MQTAYAQKTVAQIVRENYRSAGVFKTAGINYCCGGAVSLEEACLVKGLAIEDIVSALEKATQPVSLPFGLQYNHWKLEFLADYIVNVHHAYLKEVLPKLEMALLTFVSNHKKKLPFLEDVFVQFSQLAQLLQQQMEQEEESLFPYIKQLDVAYRRKETYGTLFVKTLRKPLHELEAGQDAVAKSLTGLRSLTNNYAFSEDACTNHRVIFQQLQELENDLVQHKHLENNILFPRAVETERRLLQLSNIA